MQSFSSDIQNQISGIPDGKIFTFKSLSYPPAKQANVAVILSGMLKAGQLIRVEKGAYYKPKQSRLGLGNLPVYQEEQLTFLTKKLNGYLTGAYIYNKLSLTEQVPTTITIATAKPVRAFTFNKLSMECVKAYVDTPEDSYELYLVQLLDAIKDIKHIPGVSPQDAFDKILRLHISPLPFADLKRLVSLSCNYPPRVRKVLGDMLANRDENLRNELLSTINPTTRFSLSYTL